MAEDIKRLDDKLNGEIQKLGGRMDMIETSLSKFKAQG